MSADDDFERALWNNSFYSSPAVLTELSLSNHITTFRKSVNLPSSALAQLLSGHLAAPAAGAAAVSGPQNGASNGSRKVGPAGESGSAHAGHRTSLMKVSPSMKALEKALNANLKHAEAPETIEEEEGDAPADGPLLVPEAQGERLAQPVLAFFPAPNDCAGRRTDAPHEAAAVAASTASTADDNASFVPSVLLSLRSEQKPPACSNRGHSVNDFLADPVAEMGRARDQADAAPAREREEDPQKRLPKTLLASSSCPALSDRQKHSSGPSVPGTAAPETPVRPAAHNHVPAFEERTPAPAKQAPVRSLLDSPFIASNKPSSKPPVNTSAPRGLMPASPVKASSGFATPRSLTATLNSSPRKMSFDSMKPQTAFYGQQRNTPNPRAQSTNSLPETKPVNTKRFSFRSLFKIKSKNHSLSNLKDIDEELAHGSRPAKLSAKSFSTPNMSALMLDKPEPDTRHLKAPKPAPKSDLKKRFFGKSTNASTRNLDTASVLEKLTQQLQTVEQLPVLNTIYTRAPDPNFAHSSTQPPGSGTPAAASSVFSMDTPLTAYLEPKRGTIREVEDSDYLPNLTGNLPSPSEESIRQIAPRKLFTDEAKPASPHKELSPYIAHEDIVYAPPEISSTLQFGSPFQISFSPEKLESGVRLPKISLIQSAQSPSRSVTSRMSSEQRAGETLFPKYLDAHDVESIVSLERSRSMRSIRSNKRSSFLNYNGSDENIILGKNLGNVSQGSMKRSGSILKNSPSTQSLKPDTFQLIDNAFQDTKQEFATQATSPGPNALSGDHEDLANLIEFSDFIDFDNLDFPSSPLQASSLASQVPSPSLGIYMDYERGVRSNSLEAANSEQDVSIGKVTGIDGSFDVDDQLSIRSSEKRAPALEVTLADPTPVLNESSLYDTTSAVDTSTAIETSLSFNVSEIPKKIFNSNVDEGDKESTPEIVYVSPPTNLDLDTSKIPPEENGIEKTDDSLESSTVGPPMNGTFKIAMDESKRADVPNTTPRPVSMSFKGFSGSAFKDRILPQSGSHQLIQFDEYSADENSAVGQGFGSSDEDSEDGVESYENQDDEKKFYSISSTRMADNEQKKINSFDRRQKHIKNVLDLQPPSSTLPFHHNRIPSISDQSSVSSPKLLTSFISRIRKSPLSLPKLPPARSSVKFSSRIILYDTYHHDEYDRHPEIATCNQLTPLLAQQIKEELNELKSNMEVHEDSICYTQFF